MKILYATSLVFPSGLANRLQILAMSRAFSSELKENFCLGVSQKEKDLEGIRMREFGVTKSFILSWRYLQFIRENHITHVYCREPRLLFFMELYNFFFFRLPLVTVYEIHAFPHGGILNSLLEKFLVKTTSVFIFITKHLQELYLQKFQLKNKKTFVAPDGVDLKIFDIPLSQEEARKNLHLPLNKKIICYTGRFRTMGMEKGIDVILESLKHVTEDVVFVGVGGKQRDRDYYMEEAKKLGVEHKVIFVEHIVQSLLAKYQKAADILLMPYPKSPHYEFYMSPLKMFEYMASKRPIIASDLLSVREVLSEKNAVLVMPDNALTLASTISHLLSDPENRHKLSEQAYADVQKYAWEKRVEGIVNFLS